MDDIENCHFYYGSIVQRGDLQIAISTNGKSPALAQRLRKELETQYPVEYAGWLDTLGEAREKLRAVPIKREFRGKQSYSARLASSEMFSRYVRAKERRAVAKNGDGHAAGKVYLVGRDRAIRNCLP